MYFFLIVYFVYSLFLVLVSLRIWTLYPSSLHTKYALVWFCFIFTWFKSFVFLSCSFSSSASVWYFFVCNILILIVWVCVFSWENDQKLDKNRRVFCMLVNVWIFSVHVTDFPRVYVVFYCCESVLVCVLGAHFYVQFSWQQCTSENLFVYTIDTIFCTRKKGKIHIY